jgi:transcription factor IIIB subunit 2
LGHIYKALIDELRINGNGFTVHPINPEDLILRFANRLEFGADTMRVANDAVRIVQRFDRDWMTPGRRPAGVCGAALILAARMNNFRRTTREMVYVAKVSEVTLQKRLDEFKGTESSNLTVEEFRNVDLEQACDPPAFYKQKDGQKKTRKRRRYQPEDDGDSGTESQNPTTASPNPAKRGKLSAKQNQQAEEDCRSMPPPPIPIDPALIQPSATNLAETQTPPNNEHTSPEARVVTRSPSKKSRGRPASRQHPTPPSSQTPPAGKSSQAPIISKKPSARSRKTQVPEKPPPERDLTSLLGPPATYESAAALQRALEATSDLTPEVTAPRRPIPDSEIISEEEYASDPEVINCLLTPEEFAIKERIWTHENKDYLREQQQKLMKQQLAEANGTARPVQKRKRKRGRMGDMSAYRDGDDEDGQIASSPAEAAMKMLKKRGFSKKINYEMLKEIYEPSAASSATHSPADGSRRPSTAEIGSPATPTTAAPEAADEDEHQEAEAGVGVGDLSRDMDPTGQMRAPGPSADDLTGQGGVVTGAEEVVDEDDGGDWNESELEDAGGEIGGQGYDDDDEEEEAPEEYYDGEEYD